MTGRAEGVFGVSGNFNPGQSILHPVSFVPDGDPSWPTGTRTVVAARVGATLKVAVAQIDIDFQGLCNGFSGDATQIVSTVSSEKADTFFGVPALLATITDNAIQNGLITCGVFLTNQSAAISTFSIDSVWFEVDFTQASGNKRRRDCRRTLIWE